LNTTKENAILCKDSLVFIARENKIYQSNDNGTSWKLSYTFSSDNRINKLKSKLTSLSISNPKLAAHYQYAISRIDDPEDIILPKPVVIPPGAPIGCDLD
jgi:hypothetical protein